MTGFWDNRYSDKQFVYGVQPNAYIKKKLDKLTPGKILFPAEGEGRNAIYAAKLGWDVTAFDSSEVGKSKALHLAEQNQVSLNYIISDAESFISKEKFDVLALCYAHFSFETRPQIHKQLVSYVKPGGIIIFEAFSKEQLEYNSGGPKNEKMLFSIEEIKNEFPNVEFTELTKKLVELNEGEHHKGTASVIRFVGKVLDS